MSPAATGRRPFHEQLPLERSACGAAPALAHRVIRAARVPHALADATACTAAGAVAAAPAPPRGAAASGAGGESGSGWTSAAAAAASASADAATVANGGRPLRGRGAHSDGRGSRGGR
eukprot:363634-Chlamydomonas_euryale.AAC.23